MEQQIVGGALSKVFREQNVRDCHTAHLLRLAEFDVANHLPADVNFIYYYYLLFIGLKTQRGKPHRLLPSRQSPQMARKCICAFFFTFFSQTKAQAVPPRWPWYHRVPLPPA